jgi:two-component SAPR family response regulator
VSKYVVVSDERDLNSVRMKTALIDGLLGSSPMVLTKEPQELMGFLKKEEVEVVFIKIDEVSTKGLEITRAVKRSYPMVNLVWMAYSKSYAMSAFEENIEGFILLPITKDKLQEVVKRLGCINTGIVWMSS